ncbi:MAG: VCBS repeat-containing protein [Kiritimatiellae bacterium]|nr:VCBS repeat-containing protein [Kiritimatiellia bacterium]
MKTAIPLSIGCLAFLCIAQPSAASAPSLGAGQLVYAGSSALTVSGYPSPAVADWNNDGKTDLLVGQYSSGYVWLYVNEGTDTAPVFSGRSRIYAGGSPLTTSYG